MIHMPKDIARRVIHASVDQVSHKSKVLKIPDNPATAEKRSFE
jgi:hypothetical protein